jgi:hypothetical protein
MSNKEAASIQRVPSAAFPNNALPATSIPGATTLSYRDLAAPGLPPSECTALPDPDGFKTVTYREKMAIKTRPAESVAVNKVKPRRQPSSVLAARYPCLSSRNLKGLRHCLCLGLSPRLLLLTFTSP